MGFAAVLYNFGASEIQEESIWSQLATRIFSGLNFGLLLAIAAIGISLIYGTTGLNNFAHGEMLTLGALIMWLFYSVFQLNIAVAALIAILVVAASGYAQDQFIWKPLRKRRLGLNQIMIVSIMLLFFGSETLDLGGGGNPVEFGPILTTDVAIFSMIISFIALMGVAYFLTRTRIGKATRAVSDNASLAASTGIDVERIIRIVWLFAAALTGLAGVLYGLQFQANWSVGFDILLLLFAAVTLGGLGTSMGATVGALIIGLVVEVSPLVIANELKYAVALVILIVILIFRPQGVLGKKQRIG
jgi:branched-chain amino acid transport system permease protein